MLVLNKNEDFEKEVCRVYRSVMSVDFLGCARATLVSKLFLGDSLVSNMLFFSNSFLSFFVLKLE